MTPSYALGLFFIFCVSIIWTVASVVIQYIYQEHQFNSPYLITYIGTSLFTVLLPTRLVWERRQRCCTRLRHRGTCSPQHQKEYDEALELQIIPWKTASVTNAAPRGSPSAYLSVSPDESPSSSRLGLPSSSVSAHTIENGMIGNEIEADHNSSTQSDENENANEFHRVDLLSHQLLSHQQHFRIAAKIAPVWFFANWAYNASLQYTSITSSTVLASTGSLFTFLFAVTSGDERFTTLKLAGVLLGVLGSIMTGFHDINENGGDISNSTVVRLLSETVISVDASTSATATNQVVDSVIVDGGNGGNGAFPHHHSNHPGGFDPFHWVEGNHELFGDFIGLLSAVGYGAYTVMIRVLCPRDESRMSMQLLLGYIGLLNAVCLSPLTVHVLLSPSGVPTDAAASVDGSANGNNLAQDSNYMPSPTTSGSDQLTWVVLGYLVMNGLMDNVLSDYLWARSVVLTSATVATVGLGLTIPLAFVSDWILGNENVADWISLCGASSVLIGFVLVNIDYDEIDYQAELENSRHE